MIFAQLLLVLQSLAPGINAFLSQRLLWSSLRTRPKGRFVRSFHRSPLQRHFGLPLNHYLPCPPKQPPQLTSTGEPALKDPLSPGKAYSLTSIFLPDFQYAKDTYRRALEALKGFQDKNQSDPSTFFDWLHTELVRDPAMISSEQHRALTWYLLRHFRGSLAQGMPRSRLSLEDIHEMVRIFGERILASMMAGLSTPEAIRKFKADKRTISFLASRQKGLYDELHGFVEASFAKHPEADMYKAYLLSSLSWSIRQLKKDNSLSSDDLVTLEHLQSIRSHCLAIVSRSGEQDNGAFQPVIEGFMEALSRHGLPLLSIYELESSLQKLVFIYRAGSYI